ncbi:MAG: outer membrane biosynthesis protein TonB [Algoriphagus sp.]|jgi:outer membrane biosynthesis protein TonB
MRNKIILSFAFTFALSLQLTLAQSAGDFFNKAARSYVKTEKDQALTTVNEGLSKFPSDTKLQALKEKLEQDQEKDKEEQEQKEQDQQNQEQQQKEQSQDEQQESQDKGEKTEEDKAKESQKGDPSEKSQDPASENANDQMDANLADRQKALEEFKEKLKAMNLTPEQAAQILESMNAAELRYIQQNKKKPTEQPKRGIPDW